MIIGMMTEEHNNISVQDLGIDNKTAADGLAVGTPSKFVGKIMEKYLAGIYTVQDDILFELLKKLYNNKEIKLEPSALAGFPGPGELKRNNYYGKCDIQENNISHLIWATGGSMVPQNIFQEYLSE
jgi:D-serine dehydratase